MSSLSDSAGGEVKLSVVVPVHDEHAVLATAVHAMLAPLRALIQPFEIILVENGSADGTAEIARCIEHEAAQVRVLELPVANYGAALRAGMEAAQGDVIVNFDIDYWDIPFLKDACFLVGHRFDIVIGSKNLPLSTDQRGVLRRFFSQLFRVVLKWGFGLHVTDTHGIKVWKRTPQLQDLMRQVCFDHHLFDTELIIRGQRAGMRIAELPVDVSETRKPPWGILRRIPRAAWDVLALRLRLWAESRGRAAPRR